MNNIKSLKTTLQVQYQKKTEEIINVKKYENVKEKQREMKNSNNESKN